MRKIATGCSGAVAAVFGIVLIGLVGGVYAESDVFFAADTMKWQAEDWYGDTEVTRTNEMDRDCLRVDVVGPGAGVFRTDYFPAEDWETAVTGLQADVYYLDGPVDMLLKMEIVDEDNIQLESLSETLSTSGEWLTYSWNFSAAVDYSQVAHLRAILDDVTTASGSILIDNIRLLTTAGTMAWEDFDGTTLDWALTSDTTRYDDAVIFNANGVNERTTRREQTDDTIGSLYLEWDASLDPGADYAKIFTKDPLDADWSAYSGIRFEMKSSTYDTYVYVEILDHVYTALATSVRPVTQSNEWLTYYWEFPTNSLVWTNITQLSLIVKTDQAATGHVYFDQIELVKPEPIVDTGAKWYDADTMTWVPEDWMGETEAARTNVDDKGCLHVNVSAENGAGVIRTDYFPSENWEDGVYGLQADVYQATGPGGLGLKVEMLDPDDNVIEGLSEAVTSVGAWDTYTWTFTKSLDYSSVAQLRMIFDWMVSGEADFYVDNIKLLTTEGPVLWEDFVGEPLKWALTADTTRFDDAVIFNDNGTNERTTRREQADGSIGSLYLEWDASLDPSAEYAKIFTESHLNADWSAYDGVRFKMKSSTRDTYVYVAVQDDAYETVETPVRPVTASNEWITYCWEFPTNSLVWTNIRQLAVIVKTDQAATGHVYIDEMELVEPTVAVDTDDVWFGADTVAWMAEDWMGETEAARTNFDDKSCMYVYMSAVGGAGLIRTDYFPSENWEDGVYGLQADVYQATGPAGLGLKVEILDSQNSVIEGLSEAVTSVGAWDTYTWTFTATQDYSSVAQLRMIFDWMVSGEAEFYVDNIKLLTTEGPVLWEDFVGEPMGWSIPAESVRYEDSVRFNTNGWNEKSTRIDQADYTIGSLYLEWDALLDPANYAKIFTQNPLNEDWQDYGGITFKMKATTSNTTVKVGFSDGSANYVETESRPVTQADQWLQYGWAFPEGTFDWSDVSEMAVLVNTDGEETGHVFIDQIELIPQYDYASSSWCGADSLFWTDEDWYGVTELIRTNFDGVTAAQIHVEATNGAGLIRTEYFKDENWEDPVLGMQARVYCAQGPAGMILKINAIDADGVTIEGLIQSVASQGAWHTYTFYFSEEADYSNVAKMEFLCDTISLGPATFYVDHLSLITRSGVKVWEDFGAESMLWGISPESERYDDAVLFNSVGYNDKVSHREGALGSAGALYLEWDSSLDDANYAKLFTQNPLNADWSEYDGIRFKVNASTTNTKVYAAFADCNADYLQTPAQLISQSNTWHSFELAFPPGTFAWTNVVQLALLVDTDSEDTGHVYFDEIEFTERGPVSASIWMIGRRDKQSAEFEQDSTTNAYLVDYHCMLSYEDFPDRISDDNSAISIVYDVSPSDAARDARLTVSVVPDASEHEVQVDVYVDEANQGSLTFNPRQGLEVASMVIPEVMLTNGLNTLQLVKQGSGTLLFDHLDLSSAYVVSNMFDAIAADAAIEWPYNYVVPLGTNEYPPKEDWGATPYVEPFAPRPNWMPLQTIHFTSYNFIRNIGLVPEEDQRLFMETQDSAGWGCMQRPTGQWANYPFDVYKYSPGNHYSMFPFDLDDWDWHSAETNDARYDTELGTQPFADNWPFLDKDDIPEWSRYFANMEIIDENPEGSGSWPWNCAVRAVGYIKLTPAYASHASSPRTPFYNVFSYVEDGHPDNEVQSRMPEAYFEVINDKDLLITAKTACTNSVGAYEMHVGNFHSDEMGYYSKADIRSRTYMRRDFDVSETNGRICLVGQASMFWKDEDDTVRDETDQSHDNDMVMIARTNGTFESHELGQFPEEWLDIDPQNNTDIPPIIYDLGKLDVGDTVYILQQDRYIEHYRALDKNSLDFNPHYQDRASFSYKVTHCNKDMVVKVYESIPKLDTWDNTVVTIEVATNETDVVAGDVLELDYEMISFVTPGVFFSSPKAADISKAFDSIVTLKWEAHHPVECETNYVESIDLAYSSDGLTWTTLETGYTNSGSYEWDISGLSMTSVIVRIVGTASDGMVGWDVTDGNIVLPDVPAEPGLPLLCATGETVNLQYDSEYEITWDNDPGGYTVDRVNIQYSSNGLDWVEIAWGEENDGSYTWDLFGTDLEAGDVYFRIYGLADDNTFRWDVSDGVMTIQNYKYMPINIGNKDKTDAEFHQNGEFYSTNTFNANTMFVWQFPKELGIDFWTNQQFAFDVDEEMATNGIAITFDQMLVDGEGQVEVAISFDNGAGGGFNLLTNLFFPDGDRSHVIIPTNLLEVGLATIRMEAVSATEDSTTIFWDQFLIRTLRTPGDVILGVDNGATWDFVLDADWYQTPFDERFMWDWDLPHELHTNYWTEQEIIFEANAEMASQGAILTLDVTTNSTHGMLELGVDWKQPGEEWSVVGDIALGSGSKALINVDSSLIEEGLNSLRLKLIQAIGDDVAYVHWDQIRIEAGQYAGTNQMMLGQHDGSEFEFEVVGDYYCPIFYADAMSAANFPKELGVNFWTQQIIQITLDEETANAGLRLLMDAMWMDGSGELNISVGVDNGLGYAEIDTVPVSVSQDGIVTIDGTNLLAGVNRIYLNAVSGTEGTTVVVWDRLWLTPLTGYTLHIAYADGVDNYPYAVAEQTNYTGAASLWMAMRYLLGSSFTDPQSLIYSETTHDPLHYSEITAASAATWMNDNHGITDLDLVDRTRNDLTNALKEIVYWMEFQGVLTTNFPVQILCGTNWSYKTVRGFTSDVHPYNDGTASLTNSDFSVDGLWLDDPAWDGFGHSVYCRAQELNEVYRASEAPATYHMVVNGLVDPGDVATAENNMAGSLVSINPVEENTAMATFIAGLPGNTAGAPSLETVLPLALSEDPGFMDIYAQVGRTNFYRVNTDTPDAYALAVGGLRGPGTSKFVIKLYTNGALAQATWNEVTSMYLPLPKEAAVWAARQQYGYTEDDELLSAELVFDPDLDRSAFYPRWKLSFDVSGMPQTNEVDQQALLGSDADGDGVSDIMELYVGSDPLDDESQFRLVGDGESSQGDLMVIFWESVTGREYSVSRSLDLDEDFNIRTMHIPATPPVNVYTDELIGVRGYYRVEAE